MAPSGPETMACGRLFSGAGKSLMLSAGPTAAWPRAHENTHTAATQIVLIDDMDTQPPIQWFSHHK
jgi:hypothetical protein